VQARITQLKKPVIDDYKDLRINKIERTLNVSNDAVLGRIAAAVATVL